MNPLDFIDKSKLYMEIGSNTIEELTYAYFFITDLI